MKKIYLIALLGAAFGFTACEDKLDIPQKAVLTTETFYKTDNDAQQALASAYEQFQCNTMGRAMGPGIYTPARVLATVVSIMATMNSAALSTSSVSSTRPRPLTITIKAFTSLSIMITSCCSTSPRK